jgi:hypothetical protein
VSTTRAKLVNALTFQLVWFACVLGAADGAAWPGLVMASAHVALTLLFARSATPTFSKPRALAAFVLAGVAGSAADVAQRSCGFIAYAGPALGGVWVPLWIVALWIAFATTLSSSLAWLRGPMWLSVPFAALGAPLSYLGAERLGAVTIGAPRLTSLAGVSVAWVIAFHGAQWLEARVRREP